MATEEEITAFQARLASPFLPFPNEDFSKTRLRLLVMGAFCLAVGAFDLELAKEPTVLGVTVKNLSDDVFKACLFFIDAYLLGHFIWNAIDALTEWRLRLTGHEELPHTSIGAVGAPYLPGRQGWQPDVRQATLYSYWVQQARYLGDPLGTSQRLDELISEMRAGTTAASLQELTQAATRLAHEVGRAQGIFQGVQIPATLERFDRWFKFIRVSQNLRWALFDLLLPFLVGSGGLIAVSKMWWKPALSLIGI